MDRDFQRPIFASVLVFWNRLLFRPISLDLRMCPLNNIQRIHMFPSLRITLITSWFWFFVSTLGFSQFLIFIFRKRTFLRGNKARAALLSFLEIFFLCPTLFAKFSWVFRLRISFKLWFSKLVFFCQLISIVHGKSHFPAHLFPLHITLFDVGVVPDTLVIKLLS